MQVTLVDINGTPHIIEGDNHPSDSIGNILARQSGKRFMAMASSEGDLFDPTNSQDQIDKPDRERGGKFYRLQSCRKECYHQYIVFLRTKSRTHYILAQRRFRSDYI